MWRLDPHFDPGGVSLALKTSMSIHVLSDVSSEGFATQVLPNAMQDAICIEVTQHNVTLLEWYAVQMLHVNRMRGASTIPPQGQCRSVRQNTTVRWEDSFSGMSMCLCVTLGHVQVIQQP